jgi:hypothetical protein
VGTGTLTLGSAFSNAFCTAAEAGVVNNSIISYILEEGTDFEEGEGTYTSAGPSLTRDTVFLSKIGGTAGTAKMSLAGAAVFRIPDLAEDFGKQGVASLTFGAFPGATDALVAITGQTFIRSNSNVDAWVLPAATADHSIDEHWLDPPIVFAGNVVAGTGFTIYGRVANDPPPEDDSYRRGANVRNLRTYGIWNVAWSWN